MSNNTKTINTNVVGDVIPLGSGNQYRLYCYNTWENGSLWIVEVFKEQRFFFWKWYEWKPFRYVLGTHYPTEQTVEFSKENESDEDLIIIAEDELRFLGIKI